ncbi:MAG: hypothetical protein ABMA15_23955 [Vicinamibacterales bacterium]
MRQLHPIVWLIPLALMLSVACGRRDGLTEIVKTDGSVVVGTVVEARADGVVIKTPSGETLTVPRKDITAMRAVETPADAKADGNAAEGGTAPPDAGRPDGTGKNSSNQAGNGPGNAVDGRTSSDSDKTIPPGASRDGSNASGERTFSGSGSSGTPGSAGRGEVGGTRSGPGPGDVRLPSGQDAREVVVPAGTNLSLALKSAVDSRTSKVEDRVEATLTRPVMVKDVEVLPVGTEVFGSVVEAMPSQRIKGRAYVVVRFERVKTGGFDLKIRSAPLRREAASTVKRDAKRTGIGAAIGGAVGAVVGKSKSALGIGAAAGAGVAGAEAALTKGAEIRLAPGTPLSIKLSEALTVEVSAR